MIYDRPPYDIVEQRLVAAIQALPDPEHALSELLRPSDLKTWESSLGELGAFSLKAGALAGSAAAPYPSDWLFHAVDDDVNKYLIPVYEGAWFRDLRDTDAGSPSPDTVRALGVPLSPAKATERSTGFGLYVIPVINPACDQSPLPSVDAHLVLTHPGLTESGKPPKLIGARIRRGFEDITMLDPEYRGLGIAKPFVAAALMLRVAFSRLTANPDSPIVRATLFTPGGLKTVRAAIEDVHAELTQDRELGFALQAAWDPVIEAALACGPDEENEKNEMNEKNKEPPRRSRRP